MEKYTILAGVYASAARMIQLLEELEVSGKEQAAACTVTGVKCFETVVDAWNLPTAVSTPESECEDTPF